MDNQVLQEAIKSDLSTISKLKLGILSARDLYGSIASVILKTSIIFLSINTMIRILLRFLGLQDITLSSMSLFCTWGFAFGASLFIAMMLSQYILFGKLAKGQLKTEAFIKKKCANFSLIYFGIYAIIYIIMTLVVYAFEIPPYTGSSYFKQFLDLIPSLAIAQIGSFVASFIVMSFIASMEIQRLGIAAVFDVISQFVAKIKNQPLIDLNTHNWSDD